MQGDGLHSSRFPPYVFGGSGRCPCRRGVPGPIRGFPFGTGRAYGLFPWYLFWIGGCPWDIWLQRQKEAEKERKYPVKVSVEIGKIVISCKNQAGDAKEEIFLSTEGKNLEVGFNPKYFLDALKAISDGRATKIFMPTELASAATGLGLTTEMLGIGNALGIDTRPKYPPKPEAPDACCDDKNGVTSEVVKKSKEIDKDVSDRKKQ